MKTYTGQLVSGYRVIGNQLTQVQGYQESCLWKQNSSQVMSLGDQGLRASTKKDSNPTHRYIRAP